MTQQDTASQIQCGCSFQLPQISEAASRAPVNQMIPTPSALLRLARVEDDDDRAAWCRITCAVSNL